MTASAPTRALRWAAMLFLLMGAVHVVRWVIGLYVQIGTWVAPRWISALAALLLLGMAQWCWKAAKSR